MLGTAYSRGVMLYLISCSAIVGTDTSYQTQGLRGCTDHATTSLIFCIETGCDLPTESTDTGNASFTWYRDADADGFGNPNDRLIKCRQPDGFVSRADDCADDDPNANPDAVEVCDALNTDEDCDGYADDADNNVAYKPLYWLDQDGDSWGDGHTDQRTCDNILPGLVSADHDQNGVEDDPFDCDDGNDTVYPGHGC